jgi:hypothetical protein
MNIKLKQTLLVLLFSTALSACGGGGESNDSSGSGSSTIPLVNNDPIVSTNPSSVAMNEKTTTTVNVTTSDADGDSVTVGVNKNSDAFSANLSGNTLTITTVDVDADVSGTITLTANDGKGGTATTTLSMSVAYIPEVVIVDDVDPIVSTAQFSYVFTEQTTNRIPLIMSDPQDDIVSVVVSSTSDLLTVSYDSDTMEAVVITGDVAVDTENQAFSVLVTDEQGNTAEIEKMVFILATSVANTDPEIVINTDSGIADYTVIDRTQLVIPFTASDAETDVNSLTYNVTITDLDPIQSFPYAFTYEVDVENQLVVIQMPASEIDSHDFSASIVVTDAGNLNATAELSFTILKSSATSEVVVENVPNIMFEGQTYTLNYRINAIDTDHYELVGVDYYNSGDGAENLLDFSVDEAAQTLTITPKADSAGKNISLAYTFTFREDGLTNFGLVRVNVANVWNANQIAMSDKVDELKRHLSQSMELELAAEFMLEALLLNGDISQQTYEARLIALAKLDGRVMNVEATQINYNNYVATLLMSEFYADVFQSQSAINLIDGLIRGLETTGVYVIAQTNTYATELGLGDVLVDDNAEYTLNTTARVSRFIGNTNYGSYVNSDWVFNSQFKFLDAITRKAYNNSL